jgi:CPA1 family monovalent cation:H+ antiporter
VNTGGLLAPTLIVVVGIVVLCGYLVAERTRVAPPVPLLIGGVLIGLVPYIGGVKLDPNVVLLLFLPAILFWESVSTSLREIRRNLGRIILLSTVLVLLSAAAVAVVAHAFGIGWGTSWVLGAAVAPTDATAVAALVGRLSHRDLTVLRAESLVNDGTALVIYSLAVGITVGHEHLTFLHVSGLVLLAYGGGAAIGAVMAILGAMIRRRISNPMLETVTVLLVPFAAFTLADAIDASGVLAVVIAGAMMGRAAPHAGVAASREQSRAFWSFATFVLNGALFVLVGVQVQSDVRSLGGRGFAFGLLIGVSIAVVLLLIRQTFLWLTHVIPQAIRPKSGHGPGLYANTVVGTFAGFRGGVSMAAALAVPFVISSGADFPQRNTLVFVTAVVVTLSVVGQGLLLPLVVRRFGSAPDDGLDRERAHAHEAAVDAALEVVEQRASEFEAPSDLVESMRTELNQERLAATVPADTEDANVSDEDVRMLRREDAEVRLRRAMLEARTEALIALRDAGEIDDALAHEMLGTLDLDARRFDLRSGDE